MTAPLMSAVITLLCSFYTLNTLSLSRSPGEEKLLTISGWWMLQESRSLIKSAARAAVSSMMFGSIQKLSENSTKTPFPCLPFHLKKRHLHDDHIFKHFMICYCRIQLISRRTMFDLTASCYCVTVCHSHHGLNLPLQVCWS